MNLRQVLRLSAVTLVVSMSACWAAAQTPPGEAPPLAPQDMTIPELLARAQQLSDAGQHNQAIQFLTLVTQRDPSNKQALGLLADAYWNLGNAELARKYWLQIIKNIQSNDFEANLGLGRMYMRSGVFRSAAHYLETAEKVAPPDRLIDVLIPLARAYGPLGLRDKAIETIKRAISLDPRNYDAWAVLVTLETDGATTVDEFDQADVDAQKLIQLANDIVQTEGVTQERVQQQYQAYDIRLRVLRSFGKVLFEINPDGSLSDRPIPGRETLTANVLSRVVETRLLQEDVRRVLTYFDILPIAEKAVEFDNGEHAGPLLTLALLQEKTGQLDQAAETFRRVLEIEPDNARARQHLQALGARGIGPAPTTAPSTP